MRIIACCKAAPEEQDIVVNGDGTLSFERAAWKFGSYDLNAVEAGKQLVETVGGELLGLSVGSSQLAAPKLRKDIISRGLDELVVVSDDGLQGADSLQTAQLLAAAVAQVGEWDLILCGAGSSDEYTQQVGNQLGALLGVPTLNAVNKLSPGSGAGSLLVERNLDDQTQVIEVSLPAVLSLTSGINTPRIAGMKDILAAGKKPTTELEGIGADSATAGAGAGAGTRATEITSILAPKQAQRDLKILEGEANEVAAQLVELLGSEIR